MQNQNHSEPFQKLSLLDSALSLKGIGHNAPNPKIYYGQYDQVKQQNELLEIIIQDNMKNAPICIYHTLFAGVLMFSLLCILLCFGIRWNKKEEDYDNQFVKQKQ